VGWGFVVRGGRPCHIQAVDPGGPAAAAGMKVILACGDLTRGKTYVLLELLRLNTSSVIIPPPAEEISPTELAHGALAVLGEAEGRMLSAGKVHCVRLHSGGLAFCQGTTGAVGS